MQEVSQIDAARHDAITSSGAGFGFLFAFGLAWLGAATLSYFVPPTTAAWIYLLQGVVAVPLAFAIQRAMRFPRASRSNPPSRSRFCCSLSNRWRSLFFS